MVARLFCVRRFRVISCCYTHVVSFTVLLTLYKYRISPK